ncbi:Uncharacterised protein [Arthrobacter agilis]|uniref:hypothetical protein n=1 Tax=Arthrobacter agilis TaxID=37921 RepID=UPI000F6C4A18|nr:hypothetical protein [Arthrobacter agilis]VDR32522.1 Uncharacterised protein [Arthrobacter agilis]
MSAADVVLIIVGIIAYALIALAAVAFIQACEQRGKDPDVTWQPVRAHERDTGP